MLPATRHDLHSNSTEIRGFPCFPYVSMFFQRALEVGLMWTLNPLADVNAGLIKLDGLMASNFTREDLELSKKVITGP